MSDIYPIVSMISLIDLIGHCKVCGKAVTYFARIPVHVDIQEMLYVSMNHKVELDFEVV